MEGGDHVVPTVKEVGTNDRGSSGSTDGKVLPSISTSSSSSSSSSSSGTATGGGDVYAEETGPYDSYDGYGNYGNYGNYETYYDETTPSPDASRVTSSVTGGELDLGLGSKVDMGTGAEVESKVITSGGGTSITITSNKTEVSWHEIKLTMKK